MTEKPEEAKLVQLIQEKLSSLPPEKRSELLAKIWELVDEQVKGRSE